MVWLHKSITYISLEQEALGSIQPFAEQTHILTLKEKFTATDGYVVHILLLAGCW